MLLAHVDLGAIPGLADFTQVGEDDVAHRDVWTVSTEQAVEQRVGAGIVELASAAASRARRSSNDT